MPKPEQDTLPPWVEGGFVNDKSGKATQQLRQKFQRPVPVKPKKGNPVLRKFK